MRRIRIHAMYVAIVANCLLSSYAGLARADERWGLKEGAPDLKSAGPLAFGPDGILLVGDPKGAAVFAIATNDITGEPAKVRLAIDDLTGKIGTLVGADPRQVQIQDMAVNPLSGSVYLSVAAGRGSDATPSLVRVDAKGDLSELSLKKIGFAKVVLPNPVEDKVVGEGSRGQNRRVESITDLAYSDGKVIVSGLSNDKAPANLREIPFPFITADAGISIEIYHGAHGRYEDYAAVRTFVPFNIGGEPSLLAGFTCTPLVRFPISSLSSGKRTRGTTLAELGNRNRPLDMIVYRKDGKDFLLLANNSRGVMKISTDDVARPDGLTEKIDGGGTAGQPFETIKDLQGVVQLDRLNDQHAIILVQTDSGQQNLKTVPLP